MRRARTMTLRAWRERGMRAAAEQAGANGRGTYRATILFAAVSGEEQGLLGATRLLEWTKQQGYTVGGMLDDDIVGADPAPGAPHRVRLFLGMAKSTMQIRLRGSWRVRLRR